MQSIAAALPATDGVLCFNRMYLEVTQLVRDRVAGGFFADAALMTRLDALFAGLYFAAVDAAGAGQAIPHSWSPLIELRRDPRVLPIQFALAGMNAHINHDLALAVFTACLETDTPPERIHADYLRINELLSSVEEPVRRSFLSGAIAEVDRDLSPVVHVINSWSIDRARDAAWVNAETLWALRAADDARARFLEVLARLVAFGSRALLVPTRPP